MLQLVGDDSQRQSLGARECPFPRGIVDEDTRDLHYLSNPAAILFLLKLDGERMLHLVTYSLP